MNTPLRYLRMFQPTPKLFFIGFNKCGTTSLHKFFKANGYLSAHAVVRTWPVLRSRRIPLVWEANIAAGRPPLAGIPLYRVFSGTTYDRGRVVEGNSFFRELHAAHPDAYFVLNTRPIEKWLRSRIRFKEGAMVRRHAQAHGVPEEAVPQLWREEHDRFFAEATAYFAGNPRFRVYDIENDRIEDLIAFLAPHFQLDLSRWQHMNRSAGKWSEVGLPSGDAAPQGARDPGQGG